MCYIKDKVYKRFMQIDSGLFTDFAVDKNHMSSQNKKAVCLQRKLASLIHKQKYLGVCF